MTREQTIERLKALYTNAVAAMLRADACDDDESAKVMTEYAETLDSAITALTALQTDGDCISRQAAIDAPEAQERQCATQKRRYTFGNDEFSLEAAYHDCKLVFDGITDDDSFQEADTGLILYYANEIIYALHKALEGKDINVPINDCISRQAAIDAVETKIKKWNAVDGEGYHVGLGLRYTDVIDTLTDLPSAQPEERMEKRTETHACDCISRRVALDAIIAKLDAIDHVPQWIFDELTEVIGELPSAQAEPLSDAYMKAVWTWLLNYQIKVAELKGRYTPYEVLSWVANDWRKEHEGLD